MWFFLIPAAFVGLTLFKMGSAATKLLFNVAGYKISKGNFVIKLQVTNPTKEPFKITYIFLDVIAAGNIVGQVRQENLGNTFIIQPEITNNFEVVIKPQGTSILQTILNTILSGRKPDNLLVKGYLKINDIRVPYEQTISYTTA